MSIIDTLSYKPVPVRPQQLQQNYIKPYYQMSTSNASFREMANYLRATGVKNYRFMLVLYDPDLAGVDPFDPLLSLEMKAKVLKEVQRNYWYFLREVVRVPAAGENSGVRYQLNRGNLAYNFCSMYNLNTFLEMPRQVGKTMAAVIRYLWVYNFGSSNSSLMFMNKQHPDAKRNLDMLKTVRALLPSYLQMDQVYSVISGRKKKLPDTVTTIQHPFNRNIIRTCPSARNAMAASNLIRGHTITNLWLDEWAFTKFNDVIYVNGVPALMKAFENAAKSNAPYGITITTTAGILATEEGEYAYRMIQNATVFSETWYDLTYPEIMDIIRNNMNSNYVYIRYTYKQLGLGEEWFYKVCKEMEWNMVAIRREILLEWIDTPENSPFSQDDLETLRGLVHDPINTLLVLNKYNFNIYDTIEVTMSGIPINPPIIGVDVSGGYKRDYTAISVIDSKTTKYIAGIKCNYMSIPDTARVIIWMVRTMMPNAVVNIERNGVAKAISAGRVTYQFPVLISGKKVKQKCTFVQRRNTSCITSRRSTIIS